MRAALHRITPTITFDDRFRALPPFGGPGTPQSLPHPPPSGRGWFRRRKDA
ncbi:hypothetical protein ACWD3I_36170 [Streptomyces sp. NPDC002817]|uniref:hypothetical protein n=1 Tax=Streptomyces sp. NPDC088357 TaxID=3154655 RepID=UPI003419EF23